MLQNNPIFKNRFDIYVIKYCILHITTYQPQFQENKSKNTKITNLSPQQLLKVNSSCKQCTHSNLQFRSSKSNVENEVWYTKTIKKKKKKKKQQHKNKIHGRNAATRKYVHLLPVNPLGGLSLPRNSVVRLTDSLAWLD